MVVLSAGRHKVAESLERCLPEFTHVNHYWDGRHNRVVAKILPGEFYMTSDNVVIATTLGSCISACIWDSKAGVGGMNHFMLPITTKDVADVNWGQRGLVTDATRYGNYAMEHLINTILINGGRRQNLKAKVFGGGKVLQKLSDVGQQNLAFAISYLESENIIIESTDLGNIFPRKVLFEPATGKAFVKKLTTLHNSTLEIRENTYRHSIDKQEIEGDIELF